jgi:hypothetical protein
VLFLIILIETTNPKPEDLPELRRNFHNLREIGLCFTAASFIGLGCAFL